MSSTKITLIKFIFLTTLFTFATPIIFASDKVDSAESFAGKEEMNGFRFEDFKDFEKNWHVVTVRFRKDTDELRWTFSNDLAWSNLQKGTVDYPDGSIFAKIGIATTEDPQFLSSAVPKGARRYQFMIRNKKLYADTGGWGYALFDVNGKTFPENPKISANACYACHKIVENRGQVFSQPFQLAPKVDSLFLSNATGYRKIRFKSTNVTKLSSQIKDLFKGNWTQIQTIDDPLINSNLFQGTLDEIKPTLERESYESKFPAALISTDGKRFSIILPIEKDGCKKGRSFKSIMTVLSNEKNEEKIKEYEYCNP